MAPPPHDSESRRRVARRGSARSPGNGRSPRARRCRATAAARPVVYLLERRRPRGSRSASEPRSRRDRPALARRMVSRCRRAGTAVRTSASGREHGDDQRRVRWSSASKLGVRSRSRRRRRRGGRDGGAGGMAADDVGPWGRKARSQAGGDEGLARTSAATERCSDRRTPSAAPARHEPAADDHAVRPGRGRLRGRARASRSRTRAPPARGVRLRRARRPRRTRPQRRALAGGAGHRDRVEEAARLRADRGQPLVGRRRGDERDEREPAASHAARVSPDSSSGRSGTIRPLAPPRASSRANASTPRASTMFA